MKSCSQKAWETTNTELPNGPFSKVKINKTTLGYV